MTYTFTEAKAKKYQLNNLDTGDLVKFEADVMPILFHYGIVKRYGDKLYIYHNQTSFLNKNGGSLIMEDLNEYAKGRRIVKIEKTGIDENDLQQMVDALAGHKYDLVNNNCEHFVNKLKSNNFKSPTMAYVGLGIVGIVGLIYISRL